MMHKKYSLLIFGIMAVALAQAQRPSTYEADEDRPGGFSVNKIFVGGSLNLGFAANTFQIGVVPEIGYSITNWLDAGIGLNIKYASQRADPNYIYNYNTRYRNFIYGGGPFFRVYPIRFLFVQGQFEHNRIKYNEKNYGTGLEGEAKLSANSFIAGIGYTQRIVGQSSFYTMLGIDLMNDTYSPYRDYNNAAIPIIRAGFNFYLKSSKQ